MPTAYFVTHPEVLIDPSVPVPEWPLSSQGIQRVRLMLDQPWISFVRRSSPALSERRWMLRL